MIPLQAFHKTALEHYKKNLPRMSYKNLVSHTNWKIYYKVQQGIHKTVTAYYMLEV